MNSYKLYGTSIIKNDDTIDSFALSIFEGVPVEWDTVSADNEEQKDEILEPVRQILVEDISRTDIDYAVLLEKYTRSIGMLLYQIDNHGYPMPEIHFFGDDAAFFFNELILKYTEINYIKLLSAVKKENDNEKRI